MTTQQTLSLDKRNVSTVASPPDELVHMDIIEQIAGMADDGTPGANLR